jgi:hypothetical protein
MSEVLEGFKIRTVRIDNTNEDFPNADAWQVTVTNPRGQRLQRQYFKGYGHKGAKPELVEFMDCMISDADLVEYESLEGFAANMGYDTDSISGMKKARRIYNSCERIRVRLLEFLTEPERVAFMVASGNH